MFGRQNRCERLTNQILESRKREICMTMQQIMRTMQREFKLIQILNAI